MAVILGWVTQLPDGGPDAFAQLDVELNSSNSIVVGIHELPPGSPSFRPYPQGVRFQSAPTGGRYFTPIINAPEVAILGACRSTIEPAWDGERFQPRLMLPLSLSWNHRVIDGASAARFNAYLADALSDFRRVPL